MTRKIFDEGSSLEKYIASWCAQHWFPLSLVRQRPDWVVLTYEELNINPRKCAEMMSKRLELDDEHDLADRLDRESRTTYDDKSRDVLQGTQSRSERQAYLIRRWEKQLTDEEREICTRVMNAYGIDAYHPDSSTPADHILNFSDTKDLLDRVDLDSAT